MQEREHDKKQNDVSVHAAHVLGEQGEDSACQYLLSLGYRILERNVRFGRGEIDIIAQDRRERMIVFVEVKTRTAHSDAYPIHTAMNPRKRRALRRTTARWVVAHKYEGPARLDLLSVHRGCVVEHVCNIGSDFY